MTVIGADVEALRRLAEHMNAAASTIDNEILPRLNDAIEHTPWHGFDADDFRQYWSNAGVHLLHRTSSDLTAAADRVRANADEQEAASDSNGGGVVGGVGAADAGADGAGSHATGQPHASGLTSSPADGTKYDGGFTVGQPPERRIGHDNSFPWGSKKGQDTPGDHLSWAKWWAIQHGAELLRPDLDDALPMYEHYRENAGTPMKIDYEEAYQEDQHIRYAVNGELNDTLKVANQMVGEGHTDVQFSGDMRPFQGQPATENWQKTIGAHTYWSDSHLTVEGDTAHLSVKVSEGDVWNFNRGFADQATGIPDDVNGRFQELGWAKEFETHGELTREYTWKVGEEPPFNELGTGTQSSDDERIYSGRSSGGHRWDRAEPSPGNKVNWDPLGR